MNNPIGMFMEWTRLVKVGGYIYIIIPDKRYTFDIRREDTHIEHIIDDFNSCMDECELVHYLDYCGHVDGDIGLAGGKYDRQENIHVHVFTEDSVRRLFSIIEGMFRVRVIDIRRDGMHIAVRIQTV
jgi:hypothetical protein